MTELESKWIRRIWRRYKRIPFVAIPESGKQPGINHGSWRELARARLTRLADRANRMIELGELSASQRERIQNHFNNATEAAENRYRLFNWFAAWWNGSDADKAWRNIHQAEYILLENASDRDFQARLSRTYAYISRHLGRDPEWAEDLSGLRNIVERYAPSESRAFSNRKDDRAKIGYEARRDVLQLYSVALRADDDGYTTIREYRNLLWIAFFCTTALAGLLVFVSCLVPGGIPIDLYPSENKYRAQPVSVESNIPIYEQAGVIMMFGVLGATIAVLQTLPSLPFYEAPYSLRDPQLLLKVSAGAVTAFIGVAILEAGAFPWFSAPDRIGRVVVAAILFGYAQQFVTRFIDQGAATVIRSARPYQEDPPNSTVFTGTGRSPSTVRSR